MSLVREVQPRSHLEHVEDDVPARALYDSLGSSCRGQAGRPGQTYF